jgi:hypothetical protein
MSDTRHDGSAQHALDDYLAALLSPGNEGAAPEAANTPEISDVAVAEAPHAPFVAWVFCVAGLRLAVRAGEIDTVIVAGETLQADGVSGCLGSLTHAGRACRVIDTAARVLPENRRAACPTPGVYLALKAGGWAIAADAAPTSLVIDPAKVAWRGDRATRPWLTGMLSAERIALIDPHALIRACAD